jgi:hypothetical protein
MVPLPDETARRAQMLRALLRDGSLGRFGCVALDGGPTLPLASAVEITLLGLDDLVREARGGRGVPPHEWRQVGADIELLYEEALAPPDGRPIWPEWLPPGRRTAPSPAYPRPVGPGVRLGRGIRAAPG